MEKMLSIKSIFIMLSAFAFHVLAFPIDMNRTIDFKNLDGDDYEAYDAAAAAVKRYQNIQEQARLEYEAERSLEKEHKFIRNEIVKKVNNMPEGAESKALVLQLDVLDEELKGKKRDRKNKSSVWLKEEEKIKKLVNGLGFDFDRWIKGEDPFTEELGLGPERIKRDNSASNMDCSETEKVDCQSSLMSDFNRIFKIKGSDGKALKYCISNGNHCKRNGIWHGVSFELIGKNTYHSIYKSGWVYASCHEQIADLNLLADGKVYSICQSHVKLTGNCLIKADLRMKTATFRSQDENPIGIHITNSGTQETKLLLQPGKSRSVDIDLNNGEEPVVVRCGSSIETFDKYMNKDARCNHKYELFLSKFVCRTWNWMVYFIGSFAAFLIMSSVMWLFPRTGSLIMFGISILMYPLTYLMWLVWPRLYTCEYCGDVDLILYHKHSEKCICNEADSSSTSKHHLSCLVLNKEKRKTLSNIDRFKVITRSRISPEVSKISLKIFIIIITAHILPKAIAETGMLLGDNFNESNFTITYDADTCLTSCKVENGTWSSSGLQCDCRIVKQNMPNCRYSIIEKIGSFKRMYVSDVPCSQELDLCATDVENFRYLKTGTCMMIKNDQVYEQLSSDFKPIVDSERSGCLIKCDISPVCHTAYEKSGFCEEPCICRYENNGCYVTITEQYGGKTHIMQKSHECGMASFRDECSLTYNTSQIHAISNYYMNETCQPMHVDAEIFSGDIVMAPKRIEGNALLPAWHRFMGNRKMLQIETKMLKTSIMPGLVKINPSAPQLSLNDPKHLELDAFDYSKTPLYNSKDFKTLFPNMSFPYEHTLVHKTYYSKFNTPETSRFEITMELKEKLAMGFNLVGEKHFKVKLLVYVPEVFVKYSTSYAYTTCKTKEIIVHSNDLCVGNCAECKRGLQASKNSAFFCKEDAQRLGCEASSCLNTGGALCGLCTNVKDLNDCMEIRRVESFSILATVCISVGKSIKCTHLSEGSNVLEDNFEAFISITGRQNSMKVGSLIALDKLNGKMYAGDIAQKNSMDNKFGHPQWDYKDDEIISMTPDVEWTYNCKLMGDKDVTISRCFHDTYSRKALLKEIKGEYIEYIEGPVQLKETGIIGDMKISFDMPRSAERLLESKSNVHIKSQNCKGCFKCDKGFYCELTIMSDADGSIDIECDKSSLKSKSFLLSQNDNHVEIYGHSDGNAVDKCNIKNGNAVLETFELELESLEHEEVSEQTLEYSHIYKKKAHESFLDKIKSLNPVRYLEGYIRQNLIVKMLEAMFWLAVLALFLYFLVLSKKYFILIKNTIHTVKPKPKLVKSKADVIRYKLT